MTVAALLIACVDTLVGAALAYLLWRHIRNGKGQRP